MQLYDATEGKMKQLLIRPCEDGVRSWMGGDLLSYNMLITWSTCGTGYLYQIDAQLVNIIVLCDQFNNILIVIIVLR